MAARREQVVGGGGERRRRRSGEDWARGSGLGVARGRGATAGVLSVGGEAAVKRVDGGVKLAGVLGGAAARSVAWEQ